MGPRRLLTLVLVVTVFLATGVIASVVASPSPVSACPPCDRGFVSAAQSHGFETEVGHGEATVEVSETGSATWTARVDPTNETLVDRLAGNATLARSIATDSFGTRYGGGIDHDLIGVTVEGETVVIRYRTNGVVRDGPLGTRVLTYFRDSPGAWIYTDLGADELTVVAPEGMTIAQGFGDVEGARMTATALPDDRNGPFVVFAPDDAAAPGLLGWLAVIDALGGVLVRNGLLFVGLPGGVLLGGLAMVRLIVDPTEPRDPRRLGGLVAGVGAVVLIGSLVAEADALPQLTGNLLLGGFAGAILLVLGVGVAAAEIRRLLTPPRLVLVGLAVAGIALAVGSRGPLGLGGIHTTLAVYAAVLPIAVALGWADAEANPVTDRFFVGLAVVVLGALVASAPLTELGGSLFLLLPIMMTLGAVAVVVAAVPLYFLGAAGATAGRDRPGITGRPPADLDGSP